MSVKWREDRQMWQADFVVRGRRHRPLFKTKREADDADRAAKRKRYDIDDQEVERILIAAGFKEYFEHVSAGKNRVSKLNDQLYFNLANHYLTVERKLEYLDEIALLDLEGLQKWLQPARDLGELKKGAWSASTVNRAFHTYDHFFNKMCAWGKIEKNPAQFLKSLAEKPVKRTTLTRDMYEKILAHPDTAEWFKDVLQFIWHLGPRGSSIARLTWERVDFKARTLELDTQKGAKAVTKLILLPMTDEVFALLIRVRNKWPEATGAVFRYSNGVPVRPDVISKAGTRALRACGFTNVDLYGARHGLASDLINAGVEIEVVRQLLGHSSTKVTQNYTKGTSTETLAKALKLVRGESSAPNGTNEITKAAVGSDDLG